MKAIVKPETLITTSLFILIAIIILMLTMTGCFSDRIEGNHDLVTLDRPAQAFSQVVSQGSSRVVIVPDTETRVVVKGESNILPHLYTNSDGTTLIVGYQNGINIHEHYPVEVYLHTPVLHSVKLSGSGMVDCGSFKSNSVELGLSGSGNITGNFNADQIGAIISGSGNIELTGDATTGQYSVSGSGNINAKDLVLENCSCGVSGSGNIITSVGKKLDAGISGSGSVFYLGNPVINTQINGSGKVMRY